MSAHCVLQGSFGGNLDQVQVNAARCADDGGDGVGDRGRLEEVRVAGEAEPHPRVEHRSRFVDVPVGAHLAPGRPGPDDAGADAGALELHLQRVGHAFEAPLAGGVRRHEGPGLHRDVGGDEHQVAAPALDHAGHEGPHQPMRADQVEVDLAGEPLGVDLVDGAGRDRAGVADHDLDVAEVGGDRLGEGRRPTRSRGGRVGARRPRRPGRGSRPRPPRTCRPGARRAPPGVRRPPAPAPWPHRCRRRRR